MNPPATASDPGQPATPLAQERPCQAPLATFKGRDLLGCGGPGGVGCAGAVLFVLVILIGRTFAYGPIERARGDVLVLACCGAPLVALALRRVLRPWTLRAELYSDPDRVVVRHDRGRAVAFLGELQAYREEPAGSVRLQGSPRPRRGDLGVPAADPARRALLLAALERSGVPPDGGRPGAPRAPRAERPRPLLTLQGSRGLLEHAVLGLTGALLLAPFLADVVPGLDPLRPLAWALSARPLLGVPLLLPWLVLTSRRTGRRGRVEFHEDRIAFSGEQDLTLAWDDVAGHCVGPSRAHVRLVLRPGALWFGESNVPTPTAREHEAVLALLAARGVPRVGPPLRAPVIGQRQAPAPRLTLEGWSVAGLHLPACVSLLVFVGVLAVLVASSLLGPLIGVSRVGPVTLVLVVALSGALALGSQRWVRHRAGTTEVFSDRVCLRAPDGARTVFLRDLDAFDDGSSDVMWLIPRRPPGVWARLRHASGLAALGVPARDEPVRMALLEALQRAGVTRRDDAPARPAASPAPLLVAKGRWPLPEALVVVLSGLALAVGVPLLGIDRMSGQELQRLIDLGIPLLLLAGVALIAFVAHLHPRRGRVAFFEDRVVAGGLVLAWDDLLAFAPAAGHVRLFPRPGALGDLGAVPSAPTPTAGDLEALRALLRSRGVPEVEGD